jgi:hypothetical protein
MAGRGTTTLANIIRSGIGAPPSSLGLDGDFYIDTAKLDFYGPKSNGHWPAPTSLRGPAGTNGKDGKSGTNGTDGKSVSSTFKSSTSGASGPQGIQGVTGSQGQTGPTGLTGDVGPAGSAGMAGSAGIAGSTGPAGPAGVVGSAGPAGVVGSAGPAGPAGAPGTTGTAGVMGSQGAAGSTGLAGSAGSIGPQGVAGTAGIAGVAGSVGPGGSQGSQGATGLQGVTGNTGAIGTQGVAGAIGPSQVQVVPITSWQLSTSTVGTGNSSSAFGNLAASKSYEFILGVNGKLAALQSPSYSIQVGLTLHCSDPSAVLTYNVSSSFGYTNDGNASTYSKESFIVIGTLVTTSANSSSTLSLTAIDSGTTTGVDAMTLNGNAFIQLVGAIL